MMEMILHRKRRTYFCELLWLSSLRAESARAVPQCHGARREVRTCEECCCCIPHHSEPHTHKKHTNPTSEVGICVCVHSIAPTNRICAF